MKLNDLRISCIRDANHIGIVSTAVIIGRFIVIERKTSNKWNVLRGMKGWLNLIMMTRREAIEALEYMISGECTDTQMDYVDEIEMAITDMKICEANNAGWTSVKDRLPKRAGKYLVVSKTALAELPPHVKTAWFLNNLRDNSQFKYEGEPNEPGFYNGDGEGDWVERYVTHWMPLPEPPKEG